jgi:NTP pyrophosphatase (non-canonical NTP hydrolase)
MEFKDIGVISMRHKNYINKISEFYPEDFMDRRFRCFENAEELEAAIGLAGEAGEVVDIVKKNVFYGKDLDRVAFIAEMGDAFHYFSRLCSMYGVDLDEIMEYNISKLSKRFAGEFSEEAAIAQADKDE